MSRNKNTLPASIPQAQEALASYPAPSNPQQYLTVRALLVVSLALVVGGGFPAWLAYNQGVFFQEEVRDKLPPLARQKIITFENERNRILDEILQINKALTSVSASSEAHYRLLESRRIVDEELRAHVLPLQYFGYMRTPAAQFYFPLFFLTLSALAFLARPSLPKNTHIIRRTIPFTFLIYVVWQWFHWIRNFVAGEENRSIYAFTNWDIAPGCFLYQEFEIAVICWLIALIWTQWITHYRLTCTEFDSHGYMAWSESLHHKTTERLSETFSHWQISSLLLVSAFLSFFVFYWRNIFDNGDSRYLSSALSIQVIGIASWIIISLPLLATWKHWHGLRARAIYELAISSDEVARIDLRNKMIEAVKPIGSWNLLASSSLLAISFLSPLVKMATH